MPKECSITDDVTLSTVGKYIEFSWNDESGSPRKILDTDSAMDIGLALLRRADAILSKKQTARQFLDEYRRAQRMVNGG